MRTDLYRDGRRRSQLISNADVLLVITGKDEKVTVSLVSCNPLPLGGVRGGFVTQVSPVVLEEASTFGLP